MIICEPNNCTGCLACFNICKNNAISVETDKKGFYISVIDEAKCVKCGECQKVCPQKNCKSDDIKNADVFACWSNDEKLRFSSTSGGVFSGLAELTFESGGVVCGAKFDENFKLIHDFAHNKNELSSFIGSKYVQSYIGNKYNQVKKYLDNNVSVLFCGTPCQVSALKKYLSKPYDNLLTVDLICHGVPSPRIFSDYLNLMRQENKCDIKEVSFRYKKPSWRVFSMKLETEKDTIQNDAQHDRYLVSFLNNYTLRECCYSCNYAGKERSGDITLGDFWSYVSSEKATRNDEKGISLVITNTPKGKSVLKKLENGYTIIPKDLGEAVSGGGPLVRPTEKADKCNDFWVDYLGGLSFPDCCSKYFSPTEISKRYRLGCFVNDHSYLMTDRTRRAYNRLRDKMK